MVRLERSLNRRVGTKDYYRWRISNIDPTHIEKLGWTPSQELDAEVHNDTLIIRRRGTTPKE